MLELEEIEDDDLWIERSMDPHKSGYSGNSKSRTAITSDKDLDVDETETIIDEDTWNSSESNLQQTGSDVNTIYTSTAESKLRNDHKITKLSFSPRIDADIDNLIEELDAVINDETKPKSQFR